MYPSSVELERELPDLPTESISEDEIDSIVSAVSDGERRRTEYTLDASWIEDVDTSSIEDGVLPVFGLQRE